MRGAMGLMAGIWDAFEWELAKVGACPPPSFHARFHISFHAVQHCHSEMNRGHMCSSLPLSSSHPAHVPCVLQYYDMPSPSMRNALHSAMAQDVAPFKASQKEEVAAALCCPCAVFSAAVCSVSM